MNGCGPLPFAATPRVAHLGLLWTGSTDQVQALMPATASIPIVFAGANNPFGSGVIASYARPGGNVTGTSRTGAGSLGPKLLDLLRQLTPGLTRVAVVFEQWNQGEVNDWYAVQAAAQSI